MGVYSYESEATTAIPPAKFFKAFILDAVNLFPKIIPQGAHTTEIIEGNGGPGTVKKITFGEGANLKYVKHKIGKIDEENLTYQFSVIEGDSISEYLEKIEKEIKIVASPDGGSIIKTSSKVYSKGEIDKIDEEKIKGVEQKGLALLKAAEKYLLDHPEEYN